MKKTLLLILSIFAFNLGINAQCINASFYPTSPITITNNNLVTIAINSYQSEYSQISGIVAGGSYEFTLPSGGYITVYQDGISGTLLGHGNSPLTVTSNTTGDIYPHWTTNSSCVTATNSVTTTVQWMSCTPIVAPFIEEFSTAAISSCWPTYGTVWEFGNPTTTPVGFAAYGAASITDHSTGGAGTFIGMDGSDNTNGSTGTFLTPQIDLSGVASPELSYWVFSNNTIDAGQNKLIVDFYDGSSWHQIDSIQSNLGTSWVQYTTDLTAFTITGTVRVRYTVTGVANGGQTFNNDILIDDIEILNTPPSYCIPFPTSVDNLGIINVTMGSINNSTVFESNNYGDYSAMTTDVNPNSTLAIDITLNTDNGGGTSYSYNLWAWVDWNNDNDFSDAGEEYYIGESGTSSPNTYNGSISIPATATAGNHRIRIGGADSGMPSPSGGNPCYTGSYACFEDYTLNVVTGCAAMSLPYTEGFAVTALDLPNCWTSNQAGQVQTVNSCSGSTSSLQVNGIIGAYALSPVFDASGYTSLTIDYDYRAGSATCGNAPEGGDNIDVEYWNGTTWVNLANYDGATAPIAFTAQSFTITSGLTSSFQLRFIIISGSGTNYDNYNFDNLSITGSGLSCNPTTMYTSINLTSNSFEFSWSGGGGTQWILEWDTTGFPLGTGTTVTTSSNPYTITGLSSNETYAIIIYDICASGDTSAYTWFEITTPCLSVYATPFCESFEGPTNACWQNDNIDDFDWLIHSGATVSGATGPDTANTGTFYAYTETSSPVTQGDSATLLSPSIDLSGLSNPELDFYYHMYGAGMDTDGTVKVDISNDGGTTWTNIFTEMGNHGNQWNNSVTSLASFLNQIVKFRITGIVSSTGNFYENDFAIDDFCVQEAATSCPATSSYTNISLSSTSFEFSWSGGGASEWIIEWGTVGFTQGTGTIVTTTTNPYTLNGLTGNTSYQVYITDICGVGDTSIVNGFTFLTPCGSYPIPHVNNFDFSIDCWLAYNTNADSYLWGGETYASNGCSQGDNVLRINSNPLNPMDDWLFSPGLDLVAGTNYQLDFSYSNYDILTATGKMDVFLSTGNNATDGANGTSLFSNTAIDDICNSYSNSTITVATSGVYYIGFHGYSDTNSGTLMVDDFSLTTTAACNSTTTRSTIELLANSYEFSWSGGGGTQWILEWDTGAFVPGTGANTVTTSSNPYTLTGLIPNTTYGVLIYDICASGDTSDYAWFEITTACPTVYAAPFCEGFEASSVTCWQNDNLDDFDWTIHTGSTTSTNTGPNSAHTGSMYAYTETSLPVTNGDSAILISPSIDLNGLSNPELDFYYHMFGINMNTDGEIRVEISNNEGTSWTSIFSETGDHGNQWNNSNVNLSSYLNDTVIFRIIGIVSTTGDAFGNDFAIDDFCIQETASCPIPTSPQIVDNSSATSFEFSWTTGGASEWIIEWDTAFFTQGNGNIVTTTSNPYTIAGLTQNTDYWFYLRDYCAVGDSSLWDGPFTFTTPYSCPNSTLPAYGTRGDTSTSISWTSSASTWIIEYDTSNFPIGTGTTVITNDNPYMFPNLNPNTNYSFYIRDYCSVGDTSIGTIFSFRTLMTPPDTAGSINCATGGSILVFSEEFSNNNAGWTGNIGSANGDWEIPNNSGSVGTGPDNAYSGSYFMNFEASNTSTNQGSIVSPSIDLTGGNGEAELSFWMHAFGSSMGTLNVGVGTSAAGPFTNEFTWSGQYHTTAIQDWINIGVDLTAYVGQTIYIQLTQIDDINTANGSFGYDGDMSIDLFEVNMCVSCAYTTTYTPLNLTSNSYEFSWTGGSASEWILEWDTTGFTPGTGVNTVTTTSNPYTLTGLTENTTYQVYVYDLCAIGDTSSGVWIEFTTPCGSFPIPYINDFETEVDCWTYNNANGDAASWSYSTHTNLGCFQNDDGFGLLTNSAADDWLFSPGFDLVAGTVYTLDFSYGTYAGTFGGATSENLDVFLSNGNTITDANNGTSLFSQTGLTNACSVYNNNSISISTTGTYYIAYYSNSSTGSLLTLDDFSLTVTPGVCADIITNIVDTMCTGGSYSFAGNTYTTTGIYPDTTNLASGCDSIAILDLAVITPSTTGSTISETICLGETFTFYGQNLTTAGTYYSGNQPSGNGCDSISITLSLNVTTPIINSTPTTATICLGESYSFNGINYTTAGIYYSDNIVAANGCDSTNTELTLTVNTPIITSNPTTATICLGESHSFNGMNLTSAGIYYSDNIVAANGCDSTNTELTLTVTTPIITSTPTIATICLGESYSFNGMILTSTGIYYTDNVAAANGCDSTNTELTLTVTTPIITSTPMSHTMCLGESFMFDGNSLTTGGVYYSQNVVSGNGCDSTNNKLTLIVTTPVITGIPQSEVICSGFTYDFYGTTLTSGGVYTSPNFVSGNGCDSVYYLLTLTENTSTSSNTTIDTSICVGDVFILDGLNYTTPGTYYSTGFDTANCDTVNSILILAFNTPITTNDTIYETVCEGDTFVFNNQEIYSTGMFETITLAGNNCDSINTVLDITFNTPIVTSDTTDQTICEGDTIMFNGLSYFTTGFYHYSVLTGNNCDSLKTVLNLTVNVPITTIIDTTNQSICEGDSIMFNGQFYFTTGFYHHTVLSGNNCDSSRTYLNLIIISPTEETLNESICEGETFTFAGQNLSVAGIYIDTTEGSNTCDSITTLTLTVNSNTTNTIDHVLCNSNPTYTLVDGTVVNSAGTYSAEAINSNGCKEVITYEITLCEEFVGIWEITNNVKIKVYPNPANEKVNIEFDEKLSTTNSINILNVLGQSIYNIENFDNLKLVIDTKDFSSGIYYVNVTSENSTSVKTFTISK